MARLSRWLVIFAVAASSPVLAQSLPVFPPKNVPETFFGTVVDDPYRGLENVENPQVIAWMKAQAEHTARTLKGLAGYGRLLARVAELDNATEAVIGEVRRMPDGALSTRCAPKRRPTGC